ncbi:hypothetical protein [Pseudomonas syringae]|uniref:hypothetical protein n=1 Tax=Pseudomonas syringae TaxID=317 RepID=UPI001F19249F|nr:hypothetical protein [Pseudomonas syringae]
MMRLDCGSYSPESALDLCIEGITGNALLRSGVEGAKTKLIASFKKYEQLSKIGALYQISPLDLKEDADPVVVDGLKKSDLIKIYDQYLVPGGKPAREIYEYLLAAALDDCPFCGGLGRPKNLDHFLPKFNFPQFSVLPSNLVPSCRDCNMDAKGTDFAEEAEDQVIHPYTDKDCFFNDQWIFASYRHGTDEKPGVFDFEVVPPVYWEAIDKIRAAKHFSDFNIGGRYRSVAGKSAGTILAQMHHLRKAGLSEQVIKETILDVGEATAPFVNHWKKGMYQALIAHFCPMETDDDTSQIECPHCVIGFANCPICHGGRDDVRCSDCLGSGCSHDPYAEKMRDCNRCDGEGVVGPDCCGYCNGQGTVSCDPCGGTGYLSEDDCQLCGGTERVRCRRCLGTGEASKDPYCYNCVGSGRESCPACH